MPFRVKFWGRTACCHTGEGAGLENVNGIEPHQRPAMVFAPDRDAGLAAGEDRRADRPEPLCDGAPGDLGIDDAAGRFDGAHLRRRFTVWARFSRSCACPVRKRLDSCLQQLALLPFCRRSTRWRGRRRREGAGVGPHQLPESHPPAREPSACPANRRSPAALADPVCPARRCGRTDREPPIFQRKWLAADGGDRSEMAIRRRERESRRACEARYASARGHLSGSCGTWLVVVQQIRRALACVHRWLVGSVLCAPVCGAVTGKASRIPRVRRYGCSPSRYLA